METIEQLLLKVNELLKECDKLILKAIELKKQKDEEERLHIV